MIETKIKACNYSDAIPQGELDRLGFGDHLCSIYDNEADHWAAVLSFIKGGISRNEKVVYISDPDDVELIERYLVEDSFDFNRYLWSGQLGLLETTDMLEGQAGFGTRQMLDFLQSQTQTALDNGYAGLRLSCEVSSSLPFHTIFRQLRDEEIMLDLFLCNSACIVMCQYDKTRTDPAFLLEALKVHPIAVIGTQLCDNFYYISIPGLDAEELPAVMLEHWMKTLIDNKVTVEKMKKTRANYKEIFEKATEGIFVIDAATHSVIIVNSRFCEITGHAHRDCIGIKLEKIFSAEALEIMTAAFDAVETGQKSDVVVVPITTNIGQEIFFAINIGMIEVENQRMLFGFVRDVTKSHEEHEVLAKSEESLMKAQEIREIGNWDWDLLTNDVNWSEQIYLILGLRPGEIAPGCDSYEMYVHPNDRQRVIHKVRDMIDRIKPFDDEHRIIRGDGEVRIVDLKGDVITNDEGKPVKIVYSIKDITEKCQAELALQHRIDKEKAVSNVSMVFIEEIDFFKALEKSLQELARLSDSECAYLYLLNDDFSAIEIVQGWCREDAAALFKKKSRFSLDELPWLLDKVREGKVLQVEDMQDVPDQAVLTKTMMTQNHVTSFLAIPIRVGENAIGFIELDNISPMVGEYADLLMTMSNIIGNAIRRNKAEESITHLAYHDPLTGVANRIQLEDHFELALNHAQRNNSMFAVITLDLDWFKSVNDSHGHAVGDRVLKIFADRLKGILRREDTVARVGGDEFSIIVQDIEDIDHAKKLGVKIIDALRRMHVVDEEKLKVTASIGVALYPDDGITLDELAGNADSALYFAKNQGRDNLVFYKDIKVFPQVTSLTDFD